jgi:hypothetical protein
MTIRELQSALQRIARDVTKLSASIDVLRRQNCPVPCAPTSEIRAAFSSINEELQSLAPTIAQAFCCKASMVKFIKTLVENAGYEPAIRDGGFFFPLSIEEDELTWDAYLGVDNGEEHGEKVVVAPRQVV